MRSALVALCLVTSIAHADAPARGKVIIDGVGVTLPAHWVAQLDATSGTITAREDPRRKDAALLTLAIKQVPPGTRDDALLQALLATVASAKPVAREALPGGKGEAVIAEATADGVTVRIAAIAIVDGDHAWLGMLAARQDAFDALGGAATLLAALQSVHTVNKDEQLIEDQFGRPYKRADQPDLDPGRAPVPGDELHRTVWTHTTISPPTFSEHHRIGNTVYGYNNGSGNSESYTFAVDGTFKLQTLHTIATGACKSTAIGVETGTYRHDGKVITLAPRRATLTASICGGRSQVQELTLMPRRYEVGLARDGRLILVGTGCTPFPEGGCKDHVRFELTADAHR